MEVKSNTIILLFIFIAYTLALSNAAITPFTAMDMHNMLRVSSSIQSQDGKYLIYTVRKWYNETNTVSNHLMYTNIHTLESKNITLPVQSQSDSNPFQSTAFPHLLFFLRGGQIWYIPFPTMDTDISTETQLTSYPLDINEFKLKRNTIVFNADVYFNCTDMQCSADMIAQSAKQTYQVYDQLFMFHWDHWVPQGKGSHVFYQRITLSNDSDSDSSSSVTLLNDVVDVTLHMHINAPPFDETNTHYDISNDGNMITFSGHYRTHDESWNTSWRTFYIDVTLMTTPVEISRGYAARTMNPRFSKDDTRIAFLAMKTPLLESENAHLVIYDILTDKLHDISIDEIDKGISEFEWYNDNEIMFIVNAYQVNRIAKVNFVEPGKPIYTYLTQVNVNDDIENRICSYSSLISSNYIGNYIIATKVAYHLPEHIVYIDLTTHEEKILLHPNKHIIDQFELPQAEMFEYPGANNDTAYGWILRPINFNSNATVAYPTAFLIHGGPESSWSSSWSYRWNPQIWANHGYAVVMLNPHGSTGFTTAYQAAVRNDFGGAPYEDIMLAFDYIEQHYPFINTSNACACGGSYGGYMMNWLQGHTDRFKCLVNHDGDFYTIGTFYSTDELWFQKAGSCPRDKSGCNPFDNASIRKGMEKYSPEYYVRNWKTPMLVIHGGLDYRVQLTEGLGAFTALQMKGIDSRFVYFPKENHWVTNSANGVKWNAEVLGWLDKYLKN